ncbi:MAG: ribbon-helix-helix domain-containing protein [Alphaproteobacteria bacterium]|nr:ribbon-helix-helix domain-containing protein [Alphaproteobacteria bacterium]
MPKGLGDIKQGNVTVGEGRLVCRNVLVGGRRTSMRLELYSWDALKEICEREDITLNELCSMIDQRRGVMGLTAAIRVMVLGYFRESSTQAEGRAVPRRGTPAFVADIMRHLKASD